MNREFGKLIVVLIHIYYLYICIDVLPFKNCYKKDICGFLISEYMSHKTKRKEQTIIKEKL